MANFTLTAGVDGFVGAADVADSFFVGAPGDLAATDAVDGGGGTQTVDLLRLGASMTLLAADFAGVTGIERLVFNADGGSAVTLADAMVAGSQSGFFLVSGGAGADTLFGDAVATASLRIAGNGGNDQLAAGGGADRVTGGTGDDTLAGNAGNDTLVGGQGSDRLDAGTGFDRVDGGAGDDLLVFAGNQFTLSDLVSDEAGSADTLQFTGAAALAMTSTVAARVVGIERLLFGSGNDSFTPGTAWGDGVDADTVTVQGGEGNDRLDVSSVRPLTELAFLLEGGDGTDTLTGGASDDTLDAGAGLGALNGGDGNDLFLVRTADLTGPSNIVGGDSGLAGDKLRLVGEGAIAQDALTGVAGIESLLLDPGGNEVFIPDTLPATVSNVGLEFVVRGDTGDDRVVLTAVTAGRKVSVVAGDGDDTVIGGPGNDFVLAGGGVDAALLFTGTDHVLFGPGQLNALDVATADDLAGDRLSIGLLANRTLSASAFTGVSGWDIVAFHHDTDDAVAGVRLPSNLVAQSGQSSVAVSANGSGDAVVDGRAATGTWSLTGGSGDDRLYGGSGRNTINGSAGEDTAIGGDGGDTILMSGGTTDTDLALLVAATDGTLDIGGLLSSTQLAEADRVSGLGLAGNYIGVGWRSMGLPNGTTFIATADQTLNIGSYGAARLNTADEIAGNAFGSLTAVRDAVGARFTGNDVALDERIILVIGGADEQQFGVYYFEDRDDNATVDAADILYLLAIGDTDVPAGLSPTSGFLLTGLDLG